jgi:predicted O-methyltransferase YrrM
VQHCGVEADPAYNVQLHVCDAEVTSTGDRLAATALGRDVKVLHFSGTGRQKFPSLRNLFARIPDPLAASIDRDDYAAFLASLRRWVGRRGLSSLIWSFYGTPDGYGGRVRDRTMFPLLASLHYLIRANGCSRVLETGTARGVSAACLASAIARRGGRVVTFDRDDIEGRAELWDLLPSEMRAAIEPRTGDAIDGMTAALTAGERFHAALLDSDHSADHVCREFLLATKLVCPGGLILLHDACFAGGEVPRALAAIEQRGYGVVRLWTADEGMCEDNGLGLAVIENRARPSA